MTRHNKSVFGMLMALAMGGGSGFARASGAAGRCGPYRPHQGKGECARRRRQIESRFIQRPNGLHCGDVLQIEGPDHVIRTVLADR